MLKIMVTKNPYNRNKPKNIYNDIKNSKNG